MRIENVILIFPFGPFLSREEAAKAIDSDEFLCLKIPPYGSIPGLRIYADEGSNFPVDGLPFDKVTISDVLFRNGAIAILPINGKYYLLANIEANIIEADDVIHDLSEVNEALLQINQAMQTCDKNEDVSKKILPMITKLIENVTTEAREIIAAIAVGELDSDYSDEAEKVSEIMNAPKKELQRKLPLEEV